MDLHGILVIDKPRGMTSHDVVGKVRRLLKQRKVGHAGTLDPAAEGVLVVAVGRATKLISLLSSSNKRYAAHIVLGVASETGDIEGPAVESTVARKPTIEEIESVLARFVGPIEQVPPAFSAVKVNGQPLYRRARQGEQVQVPPRTVTINSLNLIDYDYCDLFIDVECSAGTYVRTLARDIGGVLGLPAYLHYLLRTRSGRFDLSQAWTMDELEDRLTPSSFSSFASHPAVADTKGIAAVLRDDDVTAWYDGRPVPAHIDARASRTVHAFRGDGTWLGVGSGATARDSYQPRIVVHD
jgi:tRNA pseudouridine55 synthase